MRKLKNSAKKFKHELKKTLGTALVTAFGLIMAFVWKDLLTEYISSIVSISPVQGRLISAIIVTIFSVIGILIVARFLSVKK
ncbi:MAG: DUF5654 family protein [Candidatus Pacearchaeota archaeon]|nr:DUF5654 family protein [Candidatus Pacearchaeota archaeon]